MDKDLRLLAVKRFEKIDFQADTELNEIIEMASEICKTPVALITLLDDDTQWLKVKRGTDVESMPREISFCSRAIEQDDLFLVPDAAADDRFANNPIVAGAPNIRFYAGAPLVTHDGYKLGTLCVLDTEPHELEPMQQKMIKMLSKQAINIMELRISAELLENSKLEIEQQKKVIINTSTRLRSFFESSMNFHVLLGKNGEIIDFNKTANRFIERMYGKPLLVGSSFIDFLVTGFKEIFIDKYVVALSGETCQEEGFTDYGEHGIIWWDATFEPAYDPNDDIVGISYLIRDVTERKVKEQKIVDQNTSLLEIAHIQAHEFRAPLTTIMGLMDLIKEVDFDAPREYYEMMEKAVYSFDAIIKKIIGNVNGTFGASEKPK